METNGFSRIERADLKMDLLLAKSRKYKEEVGCCMCGYNKTGYALEWHSLKDEEINEPLLLVMSWKYYVEVVQKCLLMCSNCRTEVLTGITKL